jgi:hypothetical protein
VVVIGKEGYGAGFGTYHDILPIDFLFLIGNLGWVLSLGTGDEGLEEAGLLADRLRNCSVWEPRAISDGLSDHTIVPPSQDQGADDDG